MSTGEIPPSVQQQLLRLQQLQQTLSVLVGEHQRLEAELSEVNSALEELVKAELNVTVYKAVGPILVQTDKEKLKTELAEKKELAETRLKVLEKQETRTRSQIDTLQKEIQRDLPSPPPT